jgi:hypothetical protein
MRGKVMHTPSIAKRIGLFLSTMIALALLVGATLVVLAG